MIRYMKDINAHIANGNFREEDSPMIERLEDVIFVNTRSAFGDEGMRNHRSGHACDPATSGLHKFRDFVLQRFNVTRSASLTTIMSNDRYHQDQPTDSGHIVVQDPPTKILTLLVRKNYRAHPRSTGLTDRVLANPDKDAHYIQSLYPDYNVEVVSFEGMPFEDQLRQVARSDVFVAVHGAGNVHVLFLPDHAEFVEYFPPGFSQRRRFEFLADCLNVTYKREAAFIENSFDDGRISVRLNPATQE